jgi:beta-lactamase class A
VQSTIATIAAKAPGVVSVVVEGPAGVLVDLDGGRVVPAASTIKVLVMVAALDQVAAGWLALDQPVPLPVQRVGGSGPLSMLGSVSQISLAEALHLMITLSDNDATNAVLDLLGDDAVTEVGDRAGLTGTFLRRRMMDLQARAAGRENHTTARDLAHLMVRLRQGVLLPEPLTALALDVLARQQHVDGLPALLTPDVSCGNKTGELEGVRHDVALLERDGRWCSVAVTATDLADPDTGVDRGSTVWPAVAEIGAAVAEWLTTGTGRTDDLPGRRRP